MADEPRQTSKAGSAIAGSFLVLMFILACAQSCGAQDDSSTAAPTETRSSIEPSDDDTTAGPPASDTHLAVVTAGRFKEWPFTVDAGTLRCRDGVSVTFEAGGTEYGVNGTAQDAGYPSVKPIWAEDKELGNGLKVDISEVLDYGRGLC
ncbi:hypothetical protein [Streptomyces bugieae]|uniref:DUF2511 domain-containing protein n=1 Tax=Streptomyces bugieae TaxID=3098223 RepID=A0ABU7NKU6_9ACTN|nr:hypothetical protein [Streptomyces sp. DSM 41528]